MPPGDVPSEEAACLAQARAGDTRAFRWLVERHQDRAYALALRIVGSAPDAEEVAQDAFLRAWLALPGFRGEASFSTWLHRIVANRAFDRLARLRSRAALEERAAGAGVGGADEATDTARSRRLEAMIQLLPPAQRAVITLYYHEDRSVNDVARALGLPPGTVKTHLHRARRTLRNGWLRRGRMNDR